MAVISVFLIKTHGSRVCLHLQIPTFTFIYQGLRLWKYLLNTISTSLLIFQHIFTACIIFVSELTGEEPEQTANASQSIEFDPNDLDNILDQVENIDSQQKQPSPEASGLALAAERLPKPTVKETDGYQVVNGDEEIGPVFTTKPKTPTMELMTPGKTLNAPDNNKIPNTPSYIGSSESYLIGNLTKSTDQPVDHRRQVASRSVPASDSSVNIFDAYS